jgi:hypothetical protein
VDEQTAFGERLGPAERLADLVLVVLGDAQVRDVPAAP